MATILLLAATLGQQKDPSASAARPSVMIMPLTASALNAAARSAVDASIAVLITELSPFRTLTTADIEAHLGLETRKDALGCTDVTCAAEIAGALGTDLILQSQADILAGKLLLTMTLIERQSSSVRARAQSETKNEATLNRTLERWSSENF